MKQTRLFSPIAAIVLSAAGFVLGQGAMLALAQQAQQAPLTINAAMDREISTVEKEVVEAAEAMPEGKFNFSPEGINVQGSDYKGVRTFALQVRHIAASNYILWSPLTGDKFPQDYLGGNGPESLKSKAEIIKVEIAGEHGTYAPPTPRTDTAGIVLSLARQEWPDLSAYADDEIVYRVRKRHHAGLIVRSPNAERVEALLTSYVPRFYQDFHASAPPPERAAD